MAEDCLLPAISEVVSDGVAVVTRSGILRAANDALALMLDYDSQDLLLAEFGTRPAFNSRTDLEALALVASTGETMVRRLCIFTNRRGEACTLLVTALKRADGMLDAVFVTDQISSVAEIAHLRRLLRRTQYHMAQTERTKAVGSLSGFLAHELNNVFGSVIGRAQLMQMRTTDERVLRECAYIVQAAEQGVAELKRLLHFIHKSRQQFFGPLSVEEVFEEACSLLEPSFEGFRTRRIPITIEKSFELHPKIFGYVSELREIIMLLLQNALDATPEYGGRITVSCRYGAADLSLSIHDEGMGIDNQVQAKMFEPMFTTRNDQHAGMGLTIVKELLRKMKGSIAFASETGQGTTVTLTIPKNEVMPAESPLHMQTKQSELDQPFVSKILIVDDDEGVLVALDKLLASKGFITKALLDSRDAVRSARTFQPDVVITDLAMPDMNGWELAKEMRQICPATKIIMTTAFMDTLSDVEMKQTSVDVIMQKPVNIQELMNTIMSV